MSIKPWVVGEVTKCALRDARRRSRFEREKSVLDLEFETIESLLFIGAAAKQVAVAVVCYPFCSRQMAVKCIAGSRRFAIRIDMQHDQGNFFPVRANSLGIEQAPVGHQMLLVIGGEHRIVGRQIRDIRVKRRCLHQESRKKNNKSARSHGTLSGR